MYSSRLRELWDEYETLTPPPTCGCLESKKHVDHYQLQKVYPFLTGLNDSYDNAKNQVLMTRPIPNLNQTYAMIINVESQRITGKSVYGSNDNNEVASMMSDRAHNSGYNGRFNNNGGFNNSGRFTNSGYFGGYKPKNFFNKAKIQCDYCKCKGHTRKTGSSSMAILVISRTKKRRRFQCSSQQCEQDIRNSSVGRYCGLVEKNLGLYILKVADRQTPEHHIPPNVNTIVSRNKGVSLNNTSPCNDISLWHRSLGHAPLKKEDKFSPKAIPPIHMGYSSSQKGYILYDLHSKGLFVRRYDVFKKDIFPFKHMQYEVSPLFPILEVRDAQIEMITGHPASVLDLSTLGIQSLPSSPSPLHDDQSAPGPSISSTTPSAFPEGLRRSSRTSKPPIWLIDYVVEPKKIACQYPVSHHVSCNQLSSNYRASLAVYSAIVELRTFREESVDPK
ncbi:uncharacterized protein [Nicotiana sylvestris]|uniref:uncharacterized protein n=1 Tax=Nicotiana sylvestris TaxID=4096 RepID=UPI00388C662E